MSIIYLHSFKWPKPCNTCHKTILQGSSGFWDKEGKAYYHDNGKCYDTNHASPTDQINKRKGLERAPSDEADSSQKNTPIEKTGERALETGPSSVELIALWLKQSKALIHKETGADPSAESPVLAEVLKAFYGCWSIEKIQNNKMKQWR